MSARRTWALFQALSPDSAKGAGQEPPGMKVCEKISLAAHLFDLLDDGVLSPVQSVLSQKLTPTARAVRMLNMARDAVSGNISEPLVTIHGIG